MSPDKNPSRPGLLSRLFQGLRAAKPASSAGPAPAAPLELEADGTFYDDHDVCLDLTYEFYDRLGDERYWYLVRDMDRAPVPEQGGCYLVVSERERGGDTDDGYRRLVAYLDPHGRAFSTCSFITEPPARTPDVWFDRKVCCERWDGNVLVTLGGNPPMPAASWHKTPEGLIQIHGDSGLLATEKDCAHEPAEALALAFAALCLVPAENGVEAVQCDATEAITTALDADNLYDALRLLGEAGEPDGTSTLLPSPAVLDYIADLVGIERLNTLQPADLVRESLGMPPAPFVIGSMPGMNLEEILRAALSMGGGPSLVTHDGSSPLGAMLHGGAAPKVRLLHETTYTNLHYVGFDRRAVSAAGTRKLLLAESVINRADLIARTLDSMGVLQTASAGLVLHTDELLIAHTALQALPFAQGKRTVRNGAARTGSADLDVRINFARGCESLELPFRLEYGYRLCIESGVLVVDVEVPSSTLMPPLIEDEDGQGLHERTYAEREALATRYALQLAAVVGSVGFWSGEGLRYVAVNCWHGKGVAQGVDELAELDDGTLRGETMREPACVASFVFDRELFYNCVLDEGWLDAFTANEFDGLDAMTSGMRVESDDDCHLERVKPLIDIDGPELHPQGTNEKPELDDHELTGHGIALLEARTIRELGIYENAQRKEDARTVMETLRDQGDGAALALLRDMHDRTENLLVRRACDEVSRGIATGALTEQSGKRVAEVFSDIYGLEAGMRSAHKTAHTDVEQAIAQLEAMVAEADRQGWFRDTDTRRYRYFDSYAARAVYALRCDESGDGRELRLVADEYYLACHRLSALYSESFDHVEQAIDYALRAVALAPSVATSYLRLARSYFCAFDYGSEIDTLKRALAVTWNPTELGLELYWMGYALCMLDDYEAGFACYRRCVQYDASLQDPADAEVAEFLRKLGRTSLPLDENAEDEALRRAGIDLALVEQNVTFLQVAAGAVCDAGSWGLAHNLLNSAAAYLRDDAMPPVAESLEE